LVAHGEVVFVLGLSVDDLEPVFREQLSLDGT
jgi:hypothetical protein